MQLCGVWLKKLDRDYRKSLNIDGKYQFYVEKLTSPSGDMFSGIRLKDKSSLKTKDWRHMTLENMLPVYYNYFSFGFSISI